MTSWLASGSASPREHLWRGAVGALLILQAFALMALGHGSLFVLLAASQIAFAILVLRGCPICWTSGLVSTLARASPGRIAT